MKIRNGFVSNSSSSSFIINGVKITNEEAENINNKFSWRDLYDMNIKLEQNRNYFCGEDPDGYIIGVSDQGLDDGNVLELKLLTEERKQEIVNKITEDLNMQIDVENMKTYIQYISNNNY